jgi:hypothetical protein
MTLISLAKYCSAWSGLNPGLNPGLNLTSKQEIA